MDLLGPLVDFLEEAPEHFAPETFGAWGRLGDVVDQAIDTLVRAPLVYGISGRDVDLVEHLLDLGFRFGIFLTIVFLLK